MGILHRLLHKRMVSAMAWLAKVRAILLPPGQEVPSQRMCPFCGLITSRHRTFCLECGKSLKTA